MPKGFYILTGGKTSSIDHLPLRNVYKKISNISRWRTLLNLVKQDFLVSLKSQNIEPLLFCQFPGPMPMSIPMPIIYRPGCENELRVFRVHLSVLIH